jgi:transcriptional regulator with XRE-family HTH domain
MDLFALGEAFRAARIAADKTQQDVAVLTGTTKQRISRFETGQLTELGIVKLLSLFDAVGIELFVRPIGHGRTLDDVLAEQNTPTAAGDGDGETRRRVRRPKVRGGINTNPKG